MDKTRYTAGLTSLKAINDMLEVCAKHLEKAIPMCVVENNDISAKQLMFTRDNLRKAKTNLDRAINNL